MENNLKAVAFEYEVKEGNVTHKEFIKPLRHHYVIKTTGYAFSGQLRSKFGNAVISHSNEVVACGENTQANVGDFIEFEGGTRHIITTHHNDKTIYNCINRLKDSKDILIADNSIICATRNEAANIIKSVTSTDQQFKSMSLIGMDIVETIEYYYIKDHQIVSIVSKPLYIEKNMKKSLYNQRMLDKTVTKINEDINNHIKDSDIRCPFLDSSQIIDIIKHQERCIADGMMRLEEVIKLDKIGKFVLNPIKKKHLINKRFNGDVSKFEALRLDGMFDLNKDTNDN